MGIAALILGIIGGLWGVWLGIIVAAAGILVGELLRSMGAIIIILSICGIVGGAIVIGKPKAGGVLLLIASVGMIILTAFGPSWVIIVPMLLLLVGGVLGLSASRQT